MMESPDSASGKSVTGSSWFARILNVAAIVIVFGVLILIFLPPLPSDGVQSARRHQCRHNLKQIGLALHSYVDRWGALPPAYTVDANGNRLHSWRTLILPYLDQASLYKRIDLSKPWDDPVNQKAWEQNLPAYQCPGLEVPPGFTNYMAVVGPDYCFLPDRPRPLSEITDPLSATLMVFEITAAEAAHWMSPHDASPEFFLTFNSRTKIPHAGVLNILFADGSARSLSTEMPRETRQALLTVSGNEPLGEY
ncbi:DUF1559 family PulG-like putative transporter [Planctomicrobium sp. SH664]|uniref:DUF1559 family PulG-like putative transporter n=1 Tax=Planctomicrobium sp. SH664 TaxID=3448125 RepID=UPI003F5CB2FA